MGSASTASIRNTSVRGGAYVRKDFFGKYPELLELVEDMTDEQIRANPARRPRSGKVYNAYKRAVETKAAHGDSGEDDQGLRPWRRRRGTATSRTSRRS
jgi:pyruvate dehydrogenase complex dehydrogenase (E1) component